MTLFKEIHETCGDTVAIALQQHYAGQTIKISRNMPELDRSIVQQLEPFQRCTIYVPRIIDRMGRNHQIRSLHSHGESYPALIDIFGLSHRHLRSIINM